MCFLDVDIRMYIAINRMEYFIIFVNRIFHVDIRMYIAINRMEYFIIFVNRIFHNFFPKNDNRESLLSKIC